MQFGGRTFSGPKVTIAMPINCASEPLVYALRSIVLQSFASFELLVPASVDLEGGEYRSLLRDRRIILWRDTNRTMAARLNECIERARGDYFARMMPDDLAYPSRLQAQVDFLDLNAEVDLVGTQMMAFHGTGVPVGKISAPVEHRQLAMSSRLGIKLFPGTWMGRTAWFLRHRFRGGYLSEEHQKKREGQKQDEHQELLSRTLESSCFAVLPRIFYATRRVEWSRTRRALPLAAQRLLRAAAAVTGLRLDRQVAGALTAAELEEWMGLRPLLLDRGAHPHSTFPDRQVEVEAAPVTAPVGR